MLLNSISDFVLTFAQKWLSDSHSFIGNFIIFTIELPKWTQSKTENYSSLIIVRKSNNSPSNPNRKLDKSNFNLDKVLKNYLNSQYITINAVILVHAKIHSMQNESHI